jgi:outer membrane protein assembly factor BamB
MVMAAAAFGGDWMQWRGPEFNGSCEARNLPLSWSLETGENIAWTCGLPGTGQSTPVTAGGRLFLTASDNDRLFGLCIDRNTGKIEWQRELGRGRQALRGGTMAHSSAVTDGNMVCFLFGQGTLAGLSLEGAPLWKRELEDERGLLATKFGFSSTPLLHDGKLYLPLLYRADPQNEDAEPGTTLLIIDPETGRDLQAAQRPSPATRESHDSYITPVPGKNGIILTGGDLVTSHDPATGREQWRFDFAKENRRSNWRIISSPVQAGDLAVTAYPRGRRLVALAPDGRIQWEYEGYVPDVCTPAFDDGILYVLDGAKRYLTAFEAGSGRELWQEKIPSDKGFYASPLAADGKIYLLNLAGEVFIYKAGRESGLLGRVMMEADNSAASIIAVDRELYIRLPDKLACITEK